MDQKTIVAQNRYNRIAGFYDTLQLMMEKGILEKWRPEIWREVRGNVLEIGVGTGNNIPYYPEKIKVTAIDFSEKMLENAKDKAVLFNKKVDFRLMDAQNLEFPDESFDTIITTCVFCSVPDPIRGLRELKRVCKKDGQIIMLEHVRSRKPLLGFLMDIMNPLAVRISGANINRDTVLNLRKAGLNVIEERNLALDIVKHLIVRTV